MEEREDEKKKKVSNFYFFFTQITFFYISQIGSQLPLRGKFGISQKKN